MHPERPRHGDEAENARLGPTLFDVSDVVRFGSDMIVVSQGLGQRLLRHARRLAYPVMPTGAPSSRALRGTLITGKDTGDD